LRTRTVSLAAALVSGALLVGCGGGSKSSSSNENAQAPVSTGAAPTTTTTATPSTPSTTAPTSAAAIARAVAACRAVIAAAPNLAAPVKGKAEGICNKASSGDLAGARKAARQVCVEIVNSAPVANSVKEQARASCNKI
jgi:hypothetical protein